MTVLSSVPLQLLPLPAIKTIVLPGRWTKTSAGGCDLHATWPTNPRYRLLLERSERCQVRVLRPNSSWTKGKSINEMVGFYVLKQWQEKGKTKPYDAMRSAIVYESTFHPMMEASDTVELLGGQEYIVVPCTFAPATKAAFQLALSADQDFLLEPL